MTKPLSPVPVALRGGNVRSTAMRLAFAGLVALGLASCGKSGSAGAAGGAPEAAAGKVANVVLPKEITFNEHIQPILSEYCYHCHGPDSGTRKPKESPLRVDREEDVFKPRENGKPVILKGDPEASLLVQLIKTHNEKEVMPPLESHKKLKPEEIAMLEAWVRQGAKYEPHWAFAPLKRPLVPTDGEGFAQNPIDRFVAAKLAANGLQPNPPEDPRRFFRKLTFDLTGLPPAPEATEAFVKRYAEAPQQAVEEAADRMLASPACAEQFTRQWLDAARYADTHGIHIDNYRAIWPYRDWVIRAFQANMPWDQFTIEQIAGDMLPNATLDQKVASGFNRCLSTTGEGGAIADEYFAIYAKDRVETTSAIWMGLTTGCAACHDHKFDPIATKEFYALTAYFRNSTMSALDGNKADHAPNIFVPTMEDREAWGSLAGRIDATKAAIAEREKTARASFVEWLKKPGVQAPKNVDADLAIHVPLNEAGGEIKGSVNQQARSWQVEAPRTEGVTGQALVVSDHPIDLGDVGSFKRQDKVSYGGYLRIKGTPTGSVVARMNPEEKHRGWDLCIEEGKVGAHVIDVWPDVATKVVCKTELSPDEWHHVMVTFDGSRPPADVLSIYVDGKLQPVEVAKNKLGANIETGVPLRFGARAGNDYKLDAPVALQDFRFYRRLLSASEILDAATSAKLNLILNTPEAQRTKEQSDQLFRYFLDNVDQAAREMRERLNALNQSSNDMRTRGSVSLIMDEKPNEKPFAHVLTRGVYSDKGEKVEPGTPAALLPMPADAPRNRLGLARWLVDPNNALSARVTVNRAWAYIFGTGIVESTEDFGIMGARPSHPQLLEWLAGEFIDKKWDYRHMVRLMVTSAAYRQSESITPEKLEKDPANRLLSRGPRVRLEAEQLRDLALSASGLLVNKVGGPSVKPYQPENIWEAVAMKESNTRSYKQDAGDALYRRSMYTFWKRSAPPPSMELFNAPSREVFCVRRERTNTPLQALVMLNDPQFVEASKMLAAHAMQGGSDFNARLDFITQRLLGRPMKQDERKIVSTSLERMLAAYRAKPEEAGKLLAVGATPAPAGLDAAELAAWTMATSQIMNLDETVTR